MRDEDYRRKYSNLRILKSTQEYLASGGQKASAVYPIKVPDELLYQTTKIEGAGRADRLIHRIFRMGLNLWSDNLYKEEFGSQKQLEEFIQLVKKQNQE
jgi:hypothetical protein